MITQLNLFTPLLLQGLWTTIILALCSSIIGLILGTVVGVLTSTHSRIPILAPLLDSYVFCMRGIPFFVQLLIMYFVIPNLCGIDLSPFAAGALALGLCSTSYVAEIIRAGINAIPKGQWHASLVLGYTRAEALRFIILPQVIAQTIPTLANELISVLLSTSIISQIGTLELTKVGSNIISREMNPLFIYLIIAAMYLVITSFILGLTRLIERKLNHAQRQ